MSDKRPLLSLLKPATPISTPQSAVFSNARGASVEKALASLSYESAQRMRALPLEVVVERGAEYLVVAIPSGASTPELEQTIRFTTGMRPRFVETSDDHFPTTIFRAYHQDDESLARHAQKLPGFAANRDAGEPSSSVDPRGGTNDVTRFVETVLDHAVARGASDIHFAPQRLGSFLRLRVGGRLLSHDAPLCSLSIHNQIVSRIKVLASLDPTSRQKPQDGSFSLRVGDRSAYFRVSTMPTLFGEKAVLRILGTEGARPLEELGFDDRTLGTLRRVARRRRGAILLAGPTGSGKSTTLSALARELVRDGASVLTVEDPVECHIEGASQTAVDEQAGLGFAECLRAALRQDPDVILLGEMRDPESAMRACQAAITGRLVLSTLHAGTAHEAYLRLRHLGVDPLTMAQAVALVVVQRLLPRLCAECRVIDLGASNRMREEIFRPVGCSACDGAGYAGVALATETLLPSCALRSLVSDGTLGHSAFVNALDESSFAPLEHSLRPLLSRGGISLDHYLEALEYSTISSG